MSRSDPEAVDLREPSFTIETPVAPPPEPRDHGEMLRRRRRVVVLCAVAILGVAVLQQIIGLVMADQRQRHLAHEVGTPDGKITPGEAVFVLQIPQIGVNDVVAEGASSTELRGGPGRVIGSAQLIDGGNVVVLGRSTRFGAPFARLNELRPGSVIVAQARGGGLTRSYSVAMVKEVPEDSDRPLRPGADRLTLVTSEPGVLPAKHLVVVAEPDAPPPTGGGEPTRGAVLAAAALDERSTSAIGLALALLLLGLAGLGAVVGVRRLNESYSKFAVAEAVLPIVMLLVIVSIVLFDSILPATF